MDMMKAAELAGYEPYTQEFDVIVDIEDIMTADRIREMRDVVEKRAKNPGDEMENFRTVVADLRERLEAEFNERGIEPADVTVAFLIDGSGSTRGPTSLNMTLSTIELCSALDSLGAETTVMGYTTRTWKGGESRVKWLADGKPQNPGRLCDLQHIVYKPPGMEIQFGLDRLCAMAADETKRENVDGEAIMWAFDNVRNLERPRKILINVTDGAVPIDDSTIHSNGGSGLLAVHMASVLDAIEEDGQVAVSGVYVDLNKQHTKMVEEFAPIFQRSTRTHTGPDAVNTVTAMTNGLVLGLDRCLEIEPAAQASYQSR